MTDDIDDIDECVRCGEEFFGEHECDTDVALIRDGLDTVGQEALTRLLKRRPIVDIRQQGGNP